MSSRRLSPSQRYEIFVSVLSGLVLARVDATVEAGLLHLTSPWQLRQAAFRPRRRAGMAARRPAAV